MGKFMSNDSLEIRINKMESRLISKEKELTKDVESLEKDKNNYELYLQTKAEYSTLEVINEPAKSSKEEKKAWMKQRVKGALCFFMERLKFLEEVLGKYDDIVIKECCSFIETMAFHKYYINLPQHKDAGKRFIRFVRNYWSSEESTDEFTLRLLWHVYRCTLVHVSDTPSTFPFEEIDLGAKKILCLTKECVISYMNEANEDLFDPLSPLVRELDLTRQKIDVLNSLRKKWNSESDKTSKVITYQKRLDIVENLYYL